MLQRLRYILASILKNLTRWIQPKVYEDTDVFVAGAETEILRIRANIFKQEIDAYPVSVAGMRLIVRSNTGHSAAIGPMDIIGENGRARFWQLWKKYGGKSFRWPDGEAFQPCEGNPEKTAEGHEMP